jgi:hypothetical protein
VSLSKRSRNLRRRRKLQAPDGAPPAASPAPPQGKVWTSDREQPLPEWDPEPARTWYGWQTLLVDALAIGTAALTATTSIEGFWLGVGMLVVGSPIVHIAHLNFTQEQLAYDARLIAELRALGVI